MRVMAPTGFSPIKVEFNDNPAIYLYKLPFGSLCILQDSKPLLSIRSEKIDVFLKDLLARVGGNIRQKTQPSSMLVLNMD